MSEDRDRRLLAWLGAGLLAGGMPVHEVEEDVREVAWTLGHRRPQVACSANGVLVALEPGSPATFEAVEGGLRLDQLADVSALQLGVVRGRIPPDEALARLETLRAQPHRYRLTGTLAGPMLSGVGIGLILAPSLGTLLFTLAVAPLTPLVLMLGGRGSPLRTLMPFLASFVAGLLAFAAAGQGWLEAPLWAMVAPIAVILPGALLVTGLTELAAGAMVAGTSRLAYGLTQLLLFALGIGAAMAATGAPGELLDPARPTTDLWWVPLLGVVLVTLAITLSEAVPVRQTPWVLATVLLTYLAQTLTLGTVDARWAGAFVGGLTAALASTVVEWLRPELPRMVAFLPSFWLLVPGSLGLVSVTQLELGLGAAALAVVDVVVVVSAIALGVVVGSALARPLRHVARQLGLPHLMRALGRRARAR